MFTQKKSSSERATARRKPYSIHALPSGRGFHGDIEVGKAKYQLNFTPETAAVINRKLALSGSITVTSPSKQKEVVKNVTATLLATQGNIHLAPPIPRYVPPSLKADSTNTSDQPAVTDATGPFGSVGVMYLKLSGLEGKRLGVPIDLNGIQLNVRLFPSSEIESDLQWLYSGLVVSTLGEPPNEQASSEYLAEINRILKA